MIEISIRKFLESKMSVPVLMEVNPNSRVSQFVILERTGGAQVNHISTAIITIQSYAGTMQEAAELNEEVKRWMLDGIDGLITLDEVSSVNLNSDYNFTDTTSKRYRYQAVYEVTHY